MTNPTLSGTKPRLVAIACGGTGGHLYPGMAVAEELGRRGCQTTLLVSTKECDQQAVKDYVGPGSAQSEKAGVSVVSLPAVGLARGNVVGFVWGFARSYMQARRHFKGNAPQRILGMGGFASAPPLLAARRMGIPAFLHESNTIPGRANRFLAGFVEGAFVYFEHAAALLSARQVECVGMPVRRQFMEPGDPDAARTALGLQAGAPVLLVMGGSQGASKINELVLSSIGKLREALPTLQFLHLTGSRDFEKARAAYAAQNCRAVVRPFMAEMGQALAAADAAVSRSGASSLAELAARQLPALLIPYPHAADDHQYFNARAFVKSGAARMVPQHNATPELLTREIVALIEGADYRDVMRRALSRWNGRGAASVMAERILAWPERPREERASPPLHSQKLEALNA